MSIEVIDADRYWTHGTDAILVIANASVKVRRPYEFAAIPDECPKNLSP